MKPNEKNKNIAKQISEAINNEEFRSSDFGRRNEIESPKIPANNSIQRL